MKNKLSILFLLMIGLITGCITTEAVSHSPAQIISLKIESNGVTEGRIMDAIHKICFPIRVRENYTNNFFYGIKEIEVELEPVSDMQLQRVRVELEKIPGIIAVRIF